MNTPKLKFYILDSRVGDLMAETLYFRAKERNIPIEINCSMEYKVSSLPRNFDAYLLHLSNTFDRDIENLREEQPWSKVFGISGDLTKAKTSVGYLDRIFYVVGERDLDDILDKTKSIFSKQ